MRIQNEQKDIQIEQLSGQPDKGHGRITYYEKMDVTLGGLGSAGMVWTASSRTLKAAIDSTGMTLHERGGRTRDKHNAGRGFAKLCTVTDMFDGQMRSLVPTDGGGCSGDPAALSTCLARLWRTHRPLAGSTKETAVQRVQPTRNRIRRHTRWEAGCMERKKS